MTILLDNTVLSNFSMVQRPELIRLAFVEPVVTTEYVFREMQDGIAIGKIPSCDWAWLARVSLMPAEQEQFHRLATHLGQGEASCLAVAQQRGYKVATDDKDARRLARQLRLPLAGTIGILASLAKLGHITLTEGDRLLREMIDGGYRSPSETLEQILC